MDFTIQQLLTIVLVLLCPVQSFIASFIPFIQIIQWNLSSSVKQFGIYLDFQDNPQMICRLKVRGT